MGVFSGQKILVTGGAGFIGSHIVDALLKEDAEVVVIDNLSSGRKENLATSLDKINFIQADIRDDEALDRALEGVSLVSHQAALRSVPRSVNEPLKYEEVNAYGTLKLYLKCKEFGVKRVVFASSSSVYGDCYTFPQKESFLPQPISPYAATKLFGEYYGYIFSKLYSLEVISLRYFNVFGPRQSLEDEYAVVIPKFITSLLENTSPPIYGDGEQMRDFTYIDNVVLANILALRAENIAPEVFNVASGEPHSVNELFKELKKIIPSNSCACYCPPRKGDVRKTHASLEKIEKMLNYKICIDFSEGLKKTVNWFQENKGIWKKEKT